MLSQSLRVNGYAKAKYVLEVAEWRAVNEYENERVIDFVSWNASVATAKQLLAQGVKASGLCSSRTSGA